MKKNILRAIILLILLNLHSCWMPPYDAEASNSIYMLRQMDYIGEVDLKDMENQGYFIDTGDNEGFIFNKVALKVHTPDLEGISFLSIFSDGFYHVQPLKNSNGNLEIQYPAESNLSVSTNDYNSNLVFSSDRPAEPTNPLFFELQFFDGTNGTIRTTTESYDTATPPGTWSLLMDQLPAYTPVTANALYANYRYSGGYGTSDYLLFYDDVTYNVISTYEDGSIVSTLITFPGNISNGFVSRIAYHKSTNNVVVNFLNGDRKSYFFANPSTLSITDETALVPYKIEDLDSKDILICALDDGSFLFQRQNSYDSTVFKLWNPAGYTSSLSAGRLYVSDHFWIGSTHYLALNYYLESYNNDEETRKLKLYIIKDSDFKDFF